MCQHQRNGDIIICVCMQIVFLLFDIINSISFYKHPIWLCNSNYVQITF